MGWVCGVAPHLLSGGSAVPPPENPWDYGLSLTVREWYDSNVYLQDAEPAPAGGAEARAAGLEMARPGAASLVTAVQAKVDWSWHAGDALRVEMSYAPEQVIYHDADSESHVAHRGTFQVSGGNGEITWESAHLLTYVDGNGEGPVFGRPGDIPAIGGIPLRDRRESLLLRDSLKLVIPAGPGFLRPVASFYYHDFRTEQRPSTAGYVYESYVDRLEAVAGLDAGFPVQEETSFVVGYRYGAQSQFDWLGVDSAYDNRFHRILLGVEGSPREWLKLCVLAGPDLRQFSDGTRRGFDGEELLYYVDAAVTLLPNERDSVALSLRRYEQPAFSSPCIYEDINYEVNWKRRMGEHWASVAGFHLYVGDWQAPVQREDWIFTPNAALIYTLDGFSAELGYSYDWVEDRAGPVSGAPTACSPGREFTRTMVSLSAKYRF